MKRLLGRLLSAVGAVGVALGLTFGCASGELDPAGSGQLGVERAALTSCATTADCSGGQSCCTGVCKNLISLGSNGKISYGCYAAQAAPAIGNNPPADNVVPDFSFAGYKMGGVAISSSTPFGYSNTQPVGNEADDSTNIQARLDWVAAQAASGTLYQVKLAAGRFFLNKPLRIRGSNVVLRGAGQASSGPNSTILVSRIPFAHSLISVGPDDPVDYPVEQTSSKARIVQRAPVGSKTVVVSGGGPWTGCTTTQPCDVAVVRTPNQAWVKDIHMDQIPGDEDPDWQPSDFVVRHVRRVLGAVSVTGGVRLTLDIPLVDAIETAYGGGSGSSSADGSPGYVAKINDGGFVQGSGVEDLRIEANYSDRAPEDCGGGEQCECPKDEVCACPSVGRGAACSFPSHCAAGLECRDDPENPDRRTCQCPSESGRCSETGRACLLEDKSWSGIRFNRVKNSWVRRVTVLEYGYAAVRLDAQSSFNTVEEVAHVDPKSPIDPDTGLPNSSHRYSFIPGDGVGNLFQRCYTRQSRHSFVTGARATGPHVFLDCAAVEANAEQGPHFKWATGLLFDNVYSAPSSIAAATSPLAGGIRVCNNWAGGTSHGWTGAQVMLYNCESALVADAPGGAMNWVVGGIGTMHEASKNTPINEPFGIWQHNATIVKPRSLYLQQLKDRFGSTALANVATPQQQNGRLKEALLRWKGEGALSAYQDDPTCSAGTAASDSAACCPKDCGVCAETSVRPECRPLAILNGSRSCLEVGPPCRRPDPTCRWGLNETSNPTACCPSSCPACGGSGLPAECRTGNLTRSCAEYPAPCRLFDPECKAGVIRSADPDPADENIELVPAICCPADCTQCGGVGCSSAGQNCCSSDSSDSCDASMAPCRID
jgi:hypothetical protein